MSEQIIVQSKKAKQNILVIVSAVISLITLVYSYMWGNGTGNTIGEAIEYGYYTPFFVVGLPLLILALLFYFWMSNCQITVTNKRVYGKAAFGKRVDLPIDSVSAVGLHSLFNRITVATSAGQIAFYFLSEYAEIHKALCDLIVLRQNTQSNENESSATNTDEIRNLKSLLDDGVITQEEFDAKKKQLLGL